jgi:hypothetical protein
MLLPHQQFDAFPNFFDTASVSRLLRALDT